MQNKIQLPAKILKAVKTKKRFKVLIGGRGSAKSSSITKVMLMKMEAERADILCLREFQSSIDDSVHKLFKESIYEMGIEDRFYIVDNKVVCKANGRGTRYKGAAKNSSAIKSAEGFKYSFFEEAQTISQQTLEDLLPTIRHEGSELWFAGNPQSSSDPFSQRFIVPYLTELLTNGYYEDDLHLIIIMNWRDNPWFPDELNEQRLWDYEHLSRAKYNHIWEGNFNDDIENAIISPEWFDAAIGAHEKLGFKPEGIEVVAHDPSDEGEDAKALAYRHGVVIADVLEKTDGNINEGGDWASDYAIDKRTDVFIWDCDGMGIGLTRQFTTAMAPKKIELEMYKGSEGPRNPGYEYERVGAKTKTNKETFANKRAQAYWLLRERFRKTYDAVVNGVYQNPDDLISISKDIKTIDAIRSELCRIPTVPNGSGKIQIMKKEDMKTKLKLKSPNMADAIAMVMFHEHVAAAESIVQSKPLPITNHWRKK